MTSRRISPVKDIIKLISQHSSALCRTTLLLIGLTSATVTLAVPIFGTSSAASIDGIETLLAPALLISLYIVFKAVTQYIVRLIGENINDNIRREIVRKMILSFSEGRSDLDDHAWRSTLLLDLQKIRLLFEEALPRIVSSLFVAIGATIAMTWIMISSIPFIVISIGFVLVTSLAVQSLIRMRSDQARSAEEDFEVEFKSLTDGMEFFYGNSEAPRSTASIELISGRIAARFNALNRCEAALDPIVSIFGLGTIFLLIYKLLELIDFDVASGKFVDLILWLFIGVPAILDVLNAAGEISRNSASFSRIVSAVTDRGSTPIFKTTPDNALLDSISTSSFGLWFISGPSGSGKTSRIRYLCGKLASVAYLPQHRPRLDLDLANVAHYYFGLGDPNEWYECFSSHLSALNMSPAYINSLSSLKHLSGGEKGRVLVALTLCSKARVLLLDEPEAGLDAENRARLTEVLKKEATVRPVVWSGYATT